MSRVTFHTLERSVELRGTERAAGACLCNDIGVSALTRYLSTERLWSALVHRKPWATPEQIDTLLRVNRSETAIALPDGSQHTIWDVTLNTAIVLGSNPVRLLASIDAQCEIHAWIDGPDRAWFAGLIDEGRASGVLRPKMGWEEVAELCRASSDGPVAMSYSVCNGFPNWRASTWEPPEGLEDDDASEAFYALSREQRWVHGAAYLRNHPGLQIRPDTFDKPRFGSGMTAMDVVEALSPETP
jgi:hypothetical protein